MDKEVFKEYTYSVLLLLLMLIGFYFYGQLNELEYPYKYLTIPMIGLVFFIGGIGVQYFEKKDEKEIDKKEIFIFGLMAATPIMIFDIYRHLS